MKRKLIIIAICLITILSSLIVLASCDDGCVHEWDEWSVSVRATCNSQGTKQRNCLICAEIQTGVVDIAEHDYDKENIVWTWNGFESASATLYCITDSTHTRQINANITDETTSLATCTETGVKTYTATVKIDGVTYTNAKNEEIAKLKHTAVIDEAVLSTCQKTGLTEGSHCSVCNEILLAQKETPKATHTEVTIPAVASTCIAEGLSEGKKCSVCNEILVEQQPTEKSAHTEVTIPAVASTCIAEGLSEGKKCSVCNEILVDQQPTEKSAHTEVIIPAVASTCFAEGLTEGKKCSVCDEILISQQPTEKVGHTEIKIEAVSATCSAEGLTEGKKCSVCNEILIAQQPINNLSHTEIFIAGAEPSCSVEGLTDGKKCTVCNEITVEQQVIPTLPHIEEIIVAVPATCQNTGLTEGKKCSVCDKILIIQRLTQKVAHNYVPVITSPLCEAQGYTTNTCSMCDDSYINNYTSALGHTWGEWKASGSYTIRNCTNECNCGKYQRISSISATYNGIRLLTGESVWKDDVVVTATLSNGTTLAITDFTLENDVMTVDGTNYVDIKFYTASTKIAVPAIYDNLPNVTSSIEFVYDKDLALQNDAVTITGFTGASVNIVIPSYIVIDGVRVPVRYIGDSAFANNQIITAVTVAPSVKSIGKYAFQNVKYMTDITFHEGLESISGGAFMGSPIQSLNIPNSVTTIETQCYYNYSGDITSADGAFENCEKLTSVTLGNKLLAIDRETFQNCTSLATVVIGDRVETIGAYAFAGCSALTDVTIGKGVLTIYEYGFQNCIELLSIEIPGNVETISIYCFKGCERLESVTFNEGLKKICGGAFMDCPIKTLNIPNSVTTIETQCYYNYSGNITSADGAFENCEKLTSVTLGNKLLAVDRETFRDCTALVSVTIGERVETIGDYAFAGCVLLETINYDHVPTIGNYVFEGCVSLKNIDLGTGVNSVGSYAYSGCTALTSVVIPANVESLGNNVFNNCTALDDVTFVNGKDFLRSFGSNIFEGCSSLERLYYTGTSNDWAKITISEDNVYPLNVTPYYFCSSSPSAKGNFWYYNIDGAKRVWNVNETSFKAEEYSEKFANSTFGSSDSSYSSQFLSQLEEDTLFQARILIWETLHIATDSSWDSKAISKKDVYKMVIYDLLVGEADAQVNPLEGMEVACNTYLYDFAKFLLGSESLTKAELDELKKLKPLDYDYVKMADKYFKGLDVIQEIFEMTTNLYDALYVCAQYKALSDMDTNFYLVLTEISNDDSLPWDLREAASECAGCYRTATEALLKKIVLQEFAYSTMEVLWNDFQEEAWKFVLGSVFPQVKFADLTIKGAMFLANMGFNLDACNEAYYQLEAAVGLENALRNVIKNTLPDYLRYNYKDKSEYYMYAIDMYQTSVLLGFDYSNNLLREHSKSADVNDEEKQAYENMIALISDMKRDKATMYNSFESTIEQLYAIYYS